MLVGAFLLLSVIIQCALCASNLPLLRVMNSGLCCFVVDVLLFPDRINNRSHVQLYKDRDFIQLLGLDNCMHSIQISRLFVTITYFRFSSFSGGLSHPVHRYLPRSNFLSILPTITSPLSYATLLRRSTLQISQPCLNQPLPKQKPTKDF